MARKFITTRELNLIDSWNKELNQGVVQQEIIYYAISYEDSQVHDVYEEAIRKEYYQPVRIDARCEFKQGPAVAKGGTLDSSYTLLVHLHPQECRERNIHPREGDFVEYGQIVYEVSSVGYDQPVYGQINDKINYELTCVTSREGQFQVDNIKAEGIDNTHPIQPKKPRTLGDDL